LPVCPATVFTETSAIPPTSNSMSGVKSTSDRERSRPC
jgi:hypothetical protein